MVHFLQFVHLFCCSSSSTKFLKPESGGSILALNHNIFMLPKVQQVFCCFFRHYATFFSKIFGFYQRVRPCIFKKFSVCKTFKEPEWPFFWKFSALCDLKKILFLKNFFKNNVFEKIYFFCKCFQ